MDLVVHELKDHGPADDDDVPGDDEGGEPDGDGPIVAPLDHGEGDNGGEDEGLCRQWGRGPRRGGSAG